jgi:hypothetical protein
MVDGIHGIKDAYVVRKYVKKTVFCVGFRHLPATGMAITAAATAAIATLLCSRHTYRRQ